MKQHNKKNKNKNKNKKNKVNILFKQNQILIQLAGLIINTLLSVWTKL